MKNITLLDLLKSGAHFGHKTSKWNPKMKPFLYGVRGDIHIIDLAKTKDCLDNALQFVAKTISSGGTILYVGTKKQGREILKKHAQAVGNPFVALRWLGGTFTNFRHVLKTAKKLEKLQNTLSSPNLANQYTKKERLGFQREVNKLEKLFEGIKDLRKLPEAIFIADTRHDKIAVNEARSAGVKIIGLVDTNSDPSLIDYPIPCNDDSSKTLELLLSVMGVRIEEAKKQVVKKEIK